MGQPVIDTNPDLLSLTVYLVMCEHTELRRPDIPPDSFPLLVRTVETTLDSEAPDWRDRIATGEPMVVLLMNADFGDADSMRKLGDIYLMGRGVRASRAQAVNWYKLAALAGNVESQCVLGELSGEAGEWESAAKWFGLAAEQDTTGSDPNSVLVADARAELGDLYAEGRGVQRDGHEAAKWFRRAADLGTRPASTDRKQAQLRYSKPTPISPWRPHVGGFGSRRRFDVLLRFASHRSRG